MNTKKEIDMIWTPPVRLRFMDLDNTIKYTDPQTKEEKDTGKYGVRVFYAQQRDSEFQGMRNALQQRIIDVFKTIPSDIDQDWTSVLGPENQRYPNTVWFKATTKYKDRLVLVNQADRSILDSSAFYPGCWVRLLVTPAAYPGQWNKKFARFNLSGMAFYADDEPFVASISTEEALAMLNESNQVPF